VLFFSNTAIIAAPVCTAQETMSEVEAEIVGEEERTAFFYRPHRMAPVLPFMRQL